MSVNVTAGQAATVSRHNVTLVDVPYNAGNFAASGSMVWTVDPGDQIAFSYALLGDLMFVMFFIQNTSVSGTPSLNLLITIPNGKTSLRYTQAAIARIHDNGVPVPGSLHVNPGGTTIQIARMDLGNFTASANATLVQGQFWFPVS